MLDVNGESDFIKEALPLGYVDCDERQVGLGSESRHVTEAESLWWGVVAVATGDDHQADR